MMRKCGANPIYLASIAIGSFLLGGAVGLWLSKDEEDIFEDNCVKLEDLDVYSWSDLATNDKDGDFYSKEESYSMMVNKIYPDSYMSNENLDYSELKIEEKIIPDDEYEDFDEEEDENLEVFLDDKGEEVSLNPLDLEKEHVPGAPEPPYVISLEDYQMHPEFGQETLIYYEEDDTLATERDEVIHDIENTVGEKNLNRFGELSGDKDTVLVRNERLNIDYEIMREPGSYKELVLGIELDDETALKNAQQAFRKRMANEDVER